MLLVSLLAARLNAALQTLSMQFPFRPLPEFEVWVADVAIFSRKLWQRIANDDDYRGVPEWIVKVIAPSNSVGGHSAMYDVHGVIDSVILAESIPVCEIFTRCASAGNI